MLSVGAWAQDKAFLLFSCVYLCVYVVVIVVLKQISLLCGPGFKFMENPSAC